MVVAQSGTVLMVEDDDGMREAATMRFKDLLPEKLT